MTQRRNTAGSSPGVPSDPRTPESTGEMSASNTTPTVIKSTGGITPNVHIHFTSRARPGHILRRLSTGNMEPPRATSWTTRDNGLVHGSSSPVLSRSGLLQARSYTHTQNPGFVSFRESPSTPTQSRIHLVPHSQDAIRLSTMELSNMSFSSSSTVSGTQNAADDTDFIFPDISTSSSESPPSPSSSRAPSETGDLSRSQSTLASEYQVSIPSRLSSPSSSPKTPTPISPRSGASTPRHPFQPSGLSLLRQEYEASDGSRTPIAIHRPASGTDTTVTSPTTPTASTSQKVPRVHWLDRPSGSPPRTTSETAISSTPTTAVITKATAKPRLYVSPEPLPPSTEGTPLLYTTAPSVSSSLPVPPRYSQQHSRKSSSKSQSSDLLSRLVTHASRIIKSGPTGAANAFVQTSVQHTLSEIADAWEATPPVLNTAMKSIPAVLLGCLLNILDGVSYGMIIFPGTGVFANLGPLGVSMFFLSAIISQLTYTLGGSGFAGANGSMMIEVVPFFHILATSISSYIGEDKPKEIIATTLVAYAFSSILTGLTFLLLGTLKLGVIIGFFPRHILVGCIGGVGTFLIMTGLTVSMRISEDDFGANWETIEMMFMNAHKLVLWLVPMGLAILLRVITHKWRHQLIFPLYFIILPLLFYVFVTAARIDLMDLRREGWIFDIATGDHQSWYNFYSYYDFSVVSYGALWSTLPTQFALLFFNMLHPPLNVPTLSVSLDVDINTDKELVAHGYSNLLSGAFGTVPNYLVYVNTLLFYRVGGSTRVAGFLLAMMDVFLLWIGTAPIAFLPVMVVGSLIFVLGIDLVKEALWDTRHRTTRMEYVTIISIMVCMTVWDFVVGVLFGIIVSCFFFVVQNSQRKSIRSLHTGETAMSTVRRPSLQRSYLREVSKQTTIIRLQGFLFFGTISYVEDAIRTIVQGPAWQTNPIRFLVLDLSLVAGVDMSSTEAFVRIHRLLWSKSITLVFCGFAAESPVGKALESVDVLGSDGVELFSYFNDAMEWTENAYLRAWFMAQKYEATATAFALPGRQDTHSVIDSFASSPRRSYLYDVGNRTIANEIQQPDREYTSEPLNTLVKAFSSYGNIDTAMFQSIEDYLQKISLPEGSVVWMQGDPSDGLYIVESGVLRATHWFADHMQCIEESMVPGTVAGELSALSDLPRNATVIVERDAIVWRLSMENLARLETEKPSLARLFLRLILKAAKIDHDILLSALASRQ